MPPNNAYEYTTLPNPDSFRLIFLHPSPNTSDPITCTLTTSSLLYYNTSLTSHYTTLSYVWGDASSTTTILVNSLPLQITTSLETALRHIRHPDEEMRVWADGICIDQNSLEDKNRQVRLMGVIYGMARHTIIFLGEDRNEQTDEVFGILDSQESWWGAGTRSGFMINVQMRPELHLGEVAFAEVDRFVELVENHVLNRTWFSRTWILQELVLSGDPWLQIGVQRVRWSMFSSMVLRIGSVLDMARPNTYSMIAMHTLRGRFISSGTKTQLSSPCDYLLQILHSRRGRGVFDPRDMLYAHLGMHQPGMEDWETESLIAVDYQKSVVDVYTDLALYILRVQRGFGFLSHVEDVPLEDRDPDLPTWVPNWMSPYASPDAQFHFSESFRMGRIDKVHVVLGKPSVLGCVGDVIGQIEFIVESMPTTKQVEVLKGLLNEDDEDEVHYSDNDSEESEQDLPPSEDENGIPRGFDLHYIFRTLYQHLQSWVGEEYLPDYEDLEMQDDEDTLEGIFLQLKGRMKKSYPKFDGSKLMQQEPYTKWWTHQHPTRSSEKLLIRQLLMAITQEDVLAFLAGKKLAFLDNRNIALVPVYSKVGDFVVTLNDGHSVPYVLRSIKTHKISPDVDEAIIGFFEKGKNDAREKFVEYSEEGEIIWKTSGLETQHRIMLGATIELWSEYRNERNALHAEGRQQLEAKRGIKQHTHDLNPELKAQLQELSNNATRAMETASEDDRVKLWSSYINEKAAILKDHEIIEHEHIHHLDPELKTRLDELSSKVIRATNLGSEEEVLLQQVDTSEVNHVYVIGECIVDDINPELPLQDEEDHQIRDLKDKEPQYIIALH